MIEFSTIQFPRPENILSKLPVVAFLLCAFSTVALGGSKPKFSELPSGSLSHTVYINQALGIRFQVPDGWTASTDGEIPAGLDFHPAKKPERQCVKVLLSYAAANSQHPEYKSTGSLFVVDPGCFPDAKFPRAVDEGQYRDFASKIVPAFKRSPYIGPHGADMGDAQEESLLFVLLTGEDTAQLGDGSSLHENLLFSLTEFNGYWICWGWRVDDGRRAVLEKMNGIKFWMGPKGKMPDSD